MSLREEDLRHFPTYRSIGTPRIARTVAIWLILIVISLLLFALFVPWVQTARGSGQVTALDPRDRIQNVTAMVPGRVDQWFVTEGTYVQEGDVIARVMDNDPLLLDRLRAERVQIEADISAARNALRVAEIDVQRVRTLVNEGLAARQDLELAQIKVSEFRSKLAQAQARLSGIEISISRQDVQMVRAPRNGRIQQIIAGDSATMLKEGDLMATFAPEQTELVVELFMNGLDVPLIYPGRRVRLEFEGWPAVQFSGWPSIARGIFDGKVAVVDASASPNGLYRILVVQSPNDPPWPGQPEIRLGAKVRGWVLMDTVTVGYEIWRQLNDFPLQTGRPIGQGTADGQGEPKGSNAP